MNRRNFLKSTLLFVLGLWGLKFIEPKQNDAEWKKNIWVAHYAGPPKPIAQREIEQRYWVTLDSGQVLVCEFEKYYPNDNAYPVWRKVNKVGDL